ncbi:ABC-type amino acid transport system, permease component [Halanaeroarchaeum sp. HSR-CO]|uniref:amino acid ABC transporter permease n=1 Tax=Halanaeroarchaeum sp. HSR-CO TaxID=2866382 RepID=UPI00217EEBB1|nr:amino acid ABC transporter permease [Halanaeroarchaeum sp. HSR-CO]UWG47466.1 ABC-type amino acid transport system, permease component [Halanaeroarchaeum sp. HSR-CO]
MQGILGVLAQAPVGDWGFVFQNADYLAGGLWLTIQLTVASILVGFLAGFPAGVIEVYGGRYSATPVKVVGTVLRGTPLLVILIFAYFVFPIGSAFIAAVLGLGLRSAAYQSQIFKGALKSIGEGQMEAARAIGMTKLEAIYHVIVPQALRRSIPSFQNEFTIVLKDTSIAFAIGFAELLTRSYDLFVQRTTAVLEVILFVSAIYFVVTFTTNRALDYVAEIFKIPTGES